jgi:hypothetical protein
VATADSNPEPITLCVDPPRQPLQDAFAQQVQAERSPLVELALGGLAIEFAAPNAGIEFDKQLRADPSGLQISRLLCRCQHA